MPSSPKSAVVMGTPTKSTVEPVKAAVKVPKSSLRTRPSLMSASEMRRLRPTVTNGSQAMPRRSTSWSCVNFVVTELKRKNGIERFTIFAVVMRPVSSSLPVLAASQPIPAVRTRTSTLESV